jgi:hypothetical protein
MRFYGGIEGGTTPPTRTIQTVGSDGTVTYTNIPPRRPALFDMGLALGEEMAPKSPQLFRAPGATVASLWNMPLGGGMGMAPQ